LARIVAIDPGTKRLGLAVSDPGEVIAQPVGVLAAQPESTLVERLAGKISELEGEELVVGLPRRLDGIRGPEAIAAEALARQLRQATGLRVTLVDERLTSVAAERSLRAAGRKRARRRELTDPVAAALILQTHLERRRHSRQSSPER
jgi:putative holliday junction resolvase